MKFLDAAPPVLEPALVADIAARAFDLHGTLVPLYSERDQNFRLTEADGRAWVLKVVNPREDDAVLSCQVAALAHIARVDPDLPVPRHRKTGARIGAGHDWANLDDRDGRTWRLCALSFLPGRIEDGEALVPQDYRHIGATIGRLQWALAGFFHPAAGERHLLWDVRELGQLRDHAHHLGAGQTRAEGLIDQFTARALPRLAALRAQPIHGDVHAHNLVLGPDKRVAGIIDFGDLFHGPAILDLTNALVDYMHKAGDVVAMWSALAHGFHAVQPVTAAELDLAFDLMVARQLTNEIITATRSAMTPDTADYIADAGFADSRTLNHLLEVGRDRVTAILAAATGRAAPVDAQPVDQMMRRRRAVMGSRPYVFYDPPLHMVRGDGVWLYDSNGRRYLDCYNNVPIVGHCNPRVTEAIAAQSRILNTNTRYLGEQVLDYAERLGALTGGELTACAFVNSGSEANDIAWRMARAWTGHQGALCQEFAYHGITEAIDALSPSALLAATMPPHVRTLMAPDGYRGLYRDGTPDMGALYAEDTDRAIAALAASGLKPAAVIIENAFMTNGILPPCPGYVASVFAKVRAAGGLCISDEVQSGFGRMGAHFWGFQHHGVTPDFVTIGKPAGNGHPIGVVLTRPEILDHFQQQTAFFSTFGGNNVSCAAGLAVLDDIRDRDLVRNAATTGAHFKAGLQRLKDRFAIIGDVRGTGLGLGIELVRDRATLEPAPVEVKRLVNLMRDEGMLAGSEGVHGNIVKMRPPLVFSADDADFALHALDRALTRL